MIEDLRLANCGTSRFLIVALAASLTCSAAPFASGQSAAPADKAAPQKTAPQMTVPQAPAPPTPAASASQASGTVSDADRATAYYHAALADSYEDMATNFGRQDYVTRAVEEYKLALNADPNSAQLALGLAELYFRAGRARESIQTVQELLKREPDNLDAHKLLGRIYLRSLGGQDQSAQNAQNGQNAQARRRTEWADAGPGDSRVHQDRVA